MDNTSAYQKKTTNGEASEWLPATSEIPQGLVLEPIFFILYINDLEDGLKFSQSFPII